LNPGENPLRLYVGHVRLLTLKLILR